MLRVALCQVTSDSDPTQNLRIMRDRIDRAVDERARVVVFPEAMMARFGTRLRPIAEPLEGPWARSVAEMAREANVLVVAGMFTPDGDRVRNTLLITGPDTHRGYDKIHLYDVGEFRESKTVAGGSEPVVLSVDGVRLGMATCYDVRFPALFQDLAERGTDAVVVPTSWGAGPGKREQWELLVRARALDSGNWVLGCDQADPAATGVDVHPRAATGIGDSLVADPFGRVHARLGAGDDLLVTDIDPELPEQSRTASGVLHNRTR